MHKKRLTCWPTNAAAVGSTSTRNIFSFRKSEKLSLARLKWDPDAVKIFKVFDNDLKSENSKAKLKINSKY